MNTIWSLFSKDELVSSVPIESGHIHKTFKVRTQKGNYILQTFNTNVFKNKEAVVHNLKEVTQFLSSKSDYPYRVLHYVTALNGELMVKKEDTYWRAFEYIENSMVLDVADTPEQAYQAAFGFGTFVKFLKDLSPSQLQVTIPDFHNGILRLQQLKESIQKDSYQRKQFCLSEIKLIEENQDILTSIGQKIQSGFFPQRVIHYDTKINNILLDKDTQKPLCIIDLDTVMPGTVLSDFGDMVRTATPSVSENHPNPNDVFFRKNIFEGLKAGYLEATNDFLTLNERQHLTDGGKYLILMQAVRFLNDYLCGDVYYGAKYTEQNLHRTQHQLNLLQSMQKQV